MTSSGKPLNRDEFQSFVERHIAPMFTGAEIRQAPSIEIGPVRFATLKNNQSMLIRWPGLPKFQLTLRRSQYFDQADATLVNLIISNLAGLERHVIFEDAIDPAIRRSIAQLVGASFPNTLTRIIRQFEHWSEQTYEGRQISAAIGINQQSKRPRAELLLTHFKSPYGVVVANGLESFLTVTGAGRLMNRISRSLGDPRQRTRAPMRFLALARWAKGYRLGIALTRNGEVLIFKNGELAFAKRRGAWRHFPHNSVIARAGLNNRFQRPLIEAVLLTCLDISFAKTGGGIGLISKSQKQRFLASGVVKEDAKLDFSSPKSRFLSQLIRGKKFHELDRWLRMDLAAIDGSTILLRDGTIYAVGAILKISGGGSRGGGRQSAAETIGRYGLGIKVSSDGEIGGYFSKKGNGRKVINRFLFG